MFSARRFYAVTNRRYSTLSGCISRTVKQQQQQQQQFNDKAMPQFSAHILQHSNNGGITATAADRQYFVLDPEQQ